jgi:transcriptional regulator with XRE-family HTH domain
VIFSCNFWESNAGRKAKMSKNDTKIDNIEPLILANNLRILLRTRKLSENQVAQAINLPVMTIRRLISGETTDPRLSTLKLMADYFGVTIDTLIGNNQGILAHALSKNNELTLRELVVDPPQWQLQPIVNGSNILPYPDFNYKIIGIVLLTILHNKKVYS